MRISRNSSVSVHFCFSSYINLIVSEESSGFTETASAEENIFQHCYECDQGKIQREIGLGFHIFWFSLALLTN